MLTLLTCYYERKSHLLIYVAHIIKLSMLHHDTTLSEECDCNMHIELCISNLWGELIMEGRNPHVLWSNLKTYIDSLVYVALYQG